MITANIVEFHACQIQNTQSGRLERGATAVADNCVTPELFFFSVSSSQHHGRSSAAFIGMILPDTGAKRMGKFRDDPDFWRLRAQDASDPR
jgi:hypothetical protein